MDTEGTGALWSAESKTGLTSNANVILFSSDSKGTVLWKSEEGNKIISPVSILNSLLGKNFKSVG